MTRLPNSVNIYHNFRASRIIPICRTPGITWTPISEHQLDLKPDLQLVSSNRTKWCSLPIEMANIPKPPSCAALRRKVEAVTRPRSGAILSYFNSSRDFRWPSWKAPETSEEIWRMILDSTVSSIIRCHRALVSWELAKPEDLMSTTITPISLSNSTPIT